MARTKAPTYRVRTVRTKEDRKRPSVFTRLKTDEAFRGFALFEPDPEISDNPGYYEYYDHYDKQGNSYVPCAGDNCPFCRANDNPSTRALTAWYFPDNEEKERIKIFTMNFSTISAAGDEAEDEDGLLGKKLRIKRLSDKGDYRVKVLPDKPLTKKEITALLKEVEGMELPAIVERQLVTQMERLKAIDALEDDDDTDDDDDEEATRKPSTKSKRRGKEIEEDDDEDEEDEDDEDEEDEDEDEEDEEDEDEDEEEDDEEDEDEEEDDEDEDDEEEAEAEEIKASYEVVKANSGDETFDLKGDDGKKVKMWVNEGVDIDYDDFPKGTMVTVEAQQDDEGDWIITKLGKKRGRRPAAKK